ncbi:MAG: heme-binding domain-containing protein [Bacteroidales bacterium]|nr:heme-binding domain-containing protein [Bacteroidales bacterium]
MKNKRFIIILVIGILLIIQLFRINTTNPEIIQNKDYLTVSGAPQEIRTNLKNSCYDCHSYETNYPWYSKVAPVSWLLKNHIQEGREHINFSAWGDYTPEKQVALQEECAGEIEKNNMPLKSYTIIHTKAKLTPGSKKSLVVWFGQIKNSSNR